MQTAPLFTYTPSTTKPFKVSHGCNRRVPTRSLLDIHETLQGTLYLTGNGMAERTAMLDLGRAGGAAPSTGAAATAAVAPAAETNGLDLYANNSGGNGDSDIDVFPRAPSDVVVVERCHDLHNEQVRRQHYRSFLRRYFFNFSFRSDLPC